MNRTPKLATHTLTFGVLSMAKYTTDFKLSVIAHHQSNHSYKRTAKHFGLDHKTVKLWVKLYQTHGIDGIQRRSTKAVYNTDFKLNAIKQIQNGKSLTQLAIELNLPQPALLSNWLKSYQSFGIMGLTPQTQRQKSNVKQTQRQSKQINKQSNKQTKLASQTRQ